MTAPRCPYCGALSLLVKGERLYPHRADLCKRFFSKVRKTSTCWVWLGAKNKNGYGSFRLSGQATTAHRAAYLLFCGPLTDGQVVRHSCDNPPCVRPNHLLSGSQKENILDAVERGRHKAPPLHFKLTDSQVEAIRQSSLKTGKLAAKYGVSANHIWMIRTGRTRLRRVEL
jgi:hypothetical protein